MRGKEMIDLTEAFARMTKLEEDWSAVDAEREFNEMMRSYVEKWQDYISEEQLEDLFHTFVEEEFENELTEAKVRTTPEEEAEYRKMINKSPSKWNKKQKEIADKYNVTKDDVRHSRTFDTVLGNDEANYLDRAVKRDDRRRKKLDKYRADFRAGRLIDGKAFSDEIPSYTRMTGPKLAQKDDKWEKAYDDYNNLKWDNEYAAKELERSKRVLDRDQQYYDNVQKRKADFFNNLRKKEDNNAQ